MAATTASAARRERAATRAPAIVARAAELDYRPSYRAAGIASLAVFLLYLVTLSPSTAMWDTSEYIASAYVLGLPHPPGNPLFVLIGRVFSLLPIAPNVAMRINVLAALTSALSAGFWFLVTERVLVAWFAERWQRITGGALAALIGATAFTVWNQSVVNEKVYTVSLLGLAAISWLTVRWSDDPDGPAADRTLVLIAYLLGLGYSNHMMGFLAGPAVAVAVLVRKPETILRWKLLLVCLGAVALGLTVFGIQPIRASHFPPINEGEPTDWTSFWYNFNRGQYGKPDLSQRQAPFIAQLGMYWLYFKWQWLRDMNDAHPGLQVFFAIIYMFLGLLGGFVHWRRDRRSFWYFGTFMFTLTLVLIYYLNFKYGYSQDLHLGDDVPREVRDRDYFYLVSFSAWGVWAALGLVMLWESLAELFGAEQVRVGRETMALPTRRSWLATTPVLAFALVPLVANHHAASRAGESDTRDFAHDLLNSVEPYGILVTVGDNDTFPLWYAQEVEGVRKDVIVACTSLLNTDWYLRQMQRRPVYEYDAARGPAVYRGRQWRKPSGAPMKLTEQQVAAMQPYLEVTEPQRFLKETPRGRIDATIRPQVLERADLVVLQMIKDAYPDRPVYVSRTSGNYGERLGLADYLLSQGLARKLEPAPVRASPDTVRIVREGWVDVPRSDSLWRSAFLAPGSLLRRGDWVDKASMGIPYLYVSTALNLADAHQQHGDSAVASSYVKSATALAKVVGIDLFGQAAGRR